MILIEMVLGCALGLAGVVLPGANLIAMLLASYLSPVGVVACFVTGFVLGTWREAVAPETVGDPELLAVAHQVKVNPIALAGRKAVYFGVGIAVAYGFSLAGIPSLPAVLSWALILLVVALSFKSKTIEGVCALVVIGVLVKTLSGFGFHNAALSVILCLGLVPVRVREPEQESHPELNLSIHAVAGLAAALIPGINTGAVLGVIGRVGYIDAILSDALSEGISLGIFCFVRSTSKTSVTTALAIATRGTTVDGVILIASAMLLITILLNTGAFWQFVQKAPTNLMLMRIVSTVGTVIVLTDNSLGVGALMGAVVAGACLCGVATIYSRLLNQGYLPASIRRLVATGPILLG